MVRLGETWWKYTDLGCEFFTICCFSEVGWREKWMGEERWGATSEFNMQSMSTTGRKHRNLFFEKLLMILLDEDICV